MMNNYYPFENTPLPYSYDALEPYIDAKTMELHHDRHLQTYIDNLNKALNDFPAFRNLSLGQLVYSADNLPASVKNNAGGVFNHRLFFDGLGVSQKKSPDGRLKDAINATFGDFENFKKEFKAAALSVFGSGYAWLVSDNGRLRIVTTPNQDTPVAKELCPILLIDVWEHAYYLKHYNNRGDYIDDWFEVVLWDKAEENYDICMI